MKANYLVCYDIKDERRLQKVYNFVKTYGLHLQYSVFFCCFTWPQLQSFKASLAKLINLREDDVRIYSLPEKPKLFVMGCGDRVPDGVEIFL